MSAQRYQPVSANDEEDQGNSSSQQRRVPNSPPPSFRSRASSPQHHERERLIFDQDRSPLNEAFDAPSDSESDDEESDDKNANTHPQSGASQPRRPTREQLDERQRVMSGRPAASATNNVQGQEDAATAAESRSLNVSNPSSVGRGRGNTTNDGVFANISAKPTRADEEEVEEKPPTYEQAAADATPPYWSETILAPGMSDGDVFIDGLPVGSLFSFVWNALISMSFQLVGFLLTYLLHTTHAAKHGSKAGLGITLIQYGFSMRASPMAQTPDPNDPNGEFVPPPNDPNSHDFDPNNPGQGTGPGFDQGDGSGTGPMRPIDWVAYVLMIAGWFLLIRSLSQYVQARRHEQVVLASPSHGGQTPVVATGERPETAV